jgi:2-iminobutanoate/2-iminopropanoate deaminase
MKKIIPSGNLPYSKAVIHDLKYSMELAGQVGINPSGKLVEGIENQTIQTMENIGKILAEVGWDFSSIIKVRIYLSDMADYDLVNKVYRNYFSGDYPARVALAVKGLPLGALIEIECTAASDAIKG